MYIEQLKYFVDAIDSHSISGAAKKLFITQSALSQSIANLEDELGAKLLVRSNQGISATAFGRVVYEDSKEIINSVNRYKEKWDGIVSDCGLLNGEVKIVVFPSAGNTIIDRIIPEMAEACPNVLISVFEEVPSAEKNPLECMEKYNAAICLWSCVKSRFEDQMAFIEKSGYRADILCDGDQQRLLVSSKNPLSKLDAVRDDQLSDQPIAFYSDEPVPSYIRHFDQAKQFKLQQRSMIMRFVANNNAVAVFPAKVSEAEPYIRNKQIVSLPIITEDKDAFPEICRFIIHKPRSVLTDADIRVISVLKYYFK